MFIIDDDVNARTAVVSLVSGMNVPWAAFGSAEQFLNDFSRFTPCGCLVSDIRLSGMSGVELQRRLTEMETPVSTVFLTGYADVKLAVQVMQAGAVTLLEKPCRQQELWDSIWRGLTRDVERWERRQRIREVQRRIAALKPEERKVLDRVMLGMSNKLISQELGLGLRSVEHYRSCMYKTMQAESLPELVRMVLEVRGT